MATETEGMDRALFWLNQGRASAWKGDYTGTKYCVKEGRKYYKRSLREWLLGCPYWKEGNAAIKRAYGQAAFKSLTNARRFIIEGDFGLYATAISNAKWLAEMAGIDIGVKIAELQEEIERQEKIKLWECWKE